MLRRGDDKLFIQRSAMRDHLPLSTHPDFKDKLSKENSFRTFLTAKFNGHLYSFFVETPERLYG